MKKQNNKSKYKKKILAKSQTFFTQKNRHNYFNCSQNVSCLECSNKGYTPKQGEFRNNKEDVVCEKCSKNRPQSMYRALNNERSTICKECEQIACASCFEDKSTTCFPKASVYNYFHSQRKVVCTACMEKGCKNTDPKLYKCTGPCGKLYGYTKFNPWQIKNYRNKETSFLLCNTCNEKENKKLQRLRALMQKSQRRACKCGNPLGHKTNCPMFPSKFGEKPFPGCDVMTREDYEWLSYRKHRH